MRLQNLIVQKETELRNLVNQISNIVNSVQNSKATTTTYGMTKITTAGDIMSGICALDASHANGSIPGSIMWFINNLQYLKNYLPQNGDINWDNTSQHAQMRFYTYSDNNWCGMGCSPDGSLNLKVGVGTKVVWTFGTDGNLYRNKQKVI